jgi:hypothetical protein
MRWRGILGSKRNDDATRDLIVQQLNASPALISELLQARTRRS